MIPCFPVIIYLFCTFRLYHGFYLAYYGGFVRNEIAVVIDNFQIGLVGCVRGDPKAGPVGLQLAEVTVQ